MWKGILEWFDVPTDQMNNVLPNLPLFGDKVHNTADMFK
jgi:hypothetical protein